MVELVSEKFERRLSEEIGGVNNRIEQLRAELKEDNANLRAELKQDNADLKAELKTDIANSRTEMVRWMFMFWIGQVAAMIGILFAFFR